MKNLFIVMFILCVGHYNIQHKGPEHFLFDNFRKTIMSFNLNSSNYNYCIRDSKEKKKLAKYIFSSIGHFVESEPQNYKNTKYLLSRSGEIIKWNKCNLLIIILLGIVIVGAWMRLIFKFKKEKIYSGQLVHLIKNISSNHACLIESVQWIKVEDAQGRKMIRQFYEMYKKEYKKNLFMNLPLKEGKEKLSFHEKAVDYLSSLSFTEQEIADIILSSRNGVNVHKNRINKKYHQIG